MRSEVSGLRSNILWCIWTMLDVCALFWLWCSVVILYYYRWYCGDLGGYQLCWKYELCCKFVQCCAKCVLLNVVCYLVKLLQAVTSKYLSLRHSSAQISADLGSVLSCVFYLIICWAGERVYIPMYMQYPTYFQRVCSVACNVLTVCCW